LSSGSPSNPTEGLKIAFPVSDTTRHLDFAFFGW
jgi:hypothetical protein